MSVALEYTVDPSGRVSTNGVYHEVTLAEWDNLTPVAPRHYVHYRPVLEAVAQGKIVAIPASNTKKGWNVRRSVLDAARRNHQDIETRRVWDPEVQGGELILVRARQT